MKFSLILITTLLIITLTSAQTPLEIMEQRRVDKEAEYFEYNKGLVDTSHRYFYNTHADYVSKNPVQGIKYTGKRKLLFDIESVLVLVNDEFIYKKMKELKYWGFIDEYGQLERIFNNHCYYVLSSGKICFYVKAIDTDMKTDKYGNISLNRVVENSLDYISEGLTGPIMDFSEKKFQTLTATQPELFEQFQKEGIDSKVKDKRIGKTFKIKKYIDLFNLKE